MAASHGSAEAAPFRSPPSKPNGAGIGSRKVGGRSADTVHVESVSQEDADAEEDTYCRDDLGHSFPPCLAMPGRAALRNW
jgi:hypothetical protein